MSFQEIEDLERKAEQFYPHLNNRAMARKLVKGDARDLKDCPRTEEGDYIVSWFDEDAVLDYCDSSKEAWMWSVGEFPDGRVLASTSGKFYQNPECRCVWLR